MRKRASEMRTEGWYFRVKKIEPDYVPAIPANATWKKAKEAANDNYRRGKELREVLIYYKAAVNDLEEKYGVSYRPHRNRMPTLTFEFANFLY